MKERGSALRDGSGISPPCSWPRLATSPASTPRGHCAQPQAPRVRHPRLAGSHRQTSSRLVRWAAIKAVARYHRGAPSRDRLRRLPSAEARIGPTSPWAAKFSTLVYYGLPDPLPRRPRGGVTLGPHQARTRNSTSLRVHARPTAALDEGGLCVGPSQLFSDNWIPVRPAQSLAPTTTHRRLCEQVGFWDQQDEPGWRETPLTSLIMLTVAGSIPASPTR